MLIEPELTQLTVVLIGNFNPAIFHPAWLARHELISDGAAETASVGIVHPDISAFSIENLFSLQVERERFTISRLVAPWVLISDVVAKIFGDLLSHTPLSKLGINLLVHFDTGSQAKRNEIGERLAPPTPWGEWGKLVSSGDGRTRGGMQSLTMVQKNVSDRPAGWVQAKIEPSARIRGGLTGIFMEINDHYELAGPSPEDARALIGILQDKFDNSVKNSEKIVDQIMAMVK
jgi:hypothetical protein